MNARLLLPLVLLAPAASAGAFDAHKVPAAAPWVVHVDMEALSRSTVLGALHADGVFLEKEFNLDQIERDFGLKPFEDLQSLTYYGAGKNGEENVWIAVGSSALANATGKLAAKGAHTVRVNGIDALVTGLGLIAILPEQSQGQRVAVVAPSEALLSAALLVLQNESPALTPSATASTSPTIQARPTSGSLVFAASAPVTVFEKNAAFLNRALGLLCEVSDVSHEAEQTFAQATRGFAFEFAERRSDVQLSVVLDTITPGKAKELEEILRGAMTKAALPSDSAEVASRVTKLLAGLSFEKLGSRLRVNYRYPSTQLVQEIHAVEAARGIRPGN